MTPLLSDIMVNDEVIPAAAIALRCGGARGLRRRSRPVPRLDARATGAILPFEAAAPLSARCWRRPDGGKAARAFVESLAATAEVAGVDLTAA